MQAIIECHGVASWASSEYPTHATELVEHAAREGYDIVAALGLRQMGIAEDIVNMTFGIVLGAIAVAAALAFGLGARDIAAHELESWLQSLRRSEQETE